MHLCQVKNTLLASLLSFLHKMCTVQSSGQRIALKFQQQAKAENRGSVNFAKLILLKTGKATVEVR